MVVGAAVLAAGLGQVQVTTFIGRDTSAPVLRQKTTKSVKNGSANQPDGTFTPETRAKRGAGAVRAAGQALSNILPDPRTYEKCLIYSLVQNCTCKRAHSSLTGVEASHRELQEAASCSQTQTFAQEISLAASMSLQLVAA